jgi:molybdenum cofactor cytidylyltransferase
MISAILLAAGASSRYGDGINKLLLPFGESTVIRRSAQNVIDAGVKRVVVVTGHQREKIEAALDGLSITFVHNTNFLEGERMSSTKLGIEHESANLNMRAALIVLGDMPLLPPTIIRRVVEVFERNCGDIVATRVGDQRGHPVLIARKFWPEVLALPANANTRDFLKAHRDEVTHLQVNTDRVWIDVDTPELYRVALITE